MKDVLGWKARAATQKQKRPDTVFNPPREACSDQGSDLVMALNKHALNKIGMAALRRAVYITPRIIVHES